MIDNNNIQKLFQKIASVLAIIVGLFHLLNVSGIVVVSSMPLRVIHLMFMLSIAVLIKIKNAKTKISSYLIRFTGAILSFAIGIYILNRWENIIASGGVTTSVDTYFGIAMVLLLLITTWKSVGGVLAFIVGLFLIYPFVGPYMPG